MSVHGEKTHRAVTSQQVQSSRFDLELFQEQQALLNNVSGFLQVLPTRIEDFLRPLRIKLKPCSTTGMYKRK